MKNILFVLFFGLAVTFGANPDAYDALTNAERVIFSQKEPPSLQSVLKDLGVVDDWTEKAASPAVGAARTRQTGQSVRTRRCARTPRRLDAKRYGSTPMSARRVMALAASLVCNVASTK